MKVVSVNKDKHIHAENLNLLARRKRIADRGGALDDTPEEIELSRVLFVLTESEIERAAQVDTPLFKPAFTPQVLEQIALKAGSASIQYSRWVTAMLPMNAELFMNRWRLCNTPNTKLELDLNLSSEMIEWFRSNTYEKIKNITEVGQNLTRLNVSLSYIYLASKGFHHTSEQRKVMAICQNNVRYTRSQSEMVLA